MKVLIADKFQQTGIDRLTDLGCEVAFEPGLSADNLPEAICQHDPEVLVVRSTKVNEATFEAAGKLALVIRAGAGYDTIDVKTASSRGIFIANCPGKNSIAVAELAWALILSCDRRVPDQTTQLRAGTWNKKEFSKARGLYGRTLGVIGLGNIGQEVMARGWAFGMNIIANCITLTPEAAERDGIGYCSSPVDLAAKADVISIHVAACDDTKHMVNKEFCDALKPGTILINTSRGSIVDEQALTAAINEKGIRAGLDVYADEPGAGDNTFTDPIVNEQGVFGTHHIGASTDQAQEAIAAEAVRIVEVFLRTAQVENCVNLADATPATTVLTTRMLNKPGALAHIFYILGQAGINVEEMDNTIFEGTNAACAHIQLDEAPSDELIVAIRANPNILSVVVNKM